MDGGCNMKNPYYYIKRILKKVFTLKLFFNRAHNYIALPLDLAKDFMIFMTFIKVYYPLANYWIGLPFFLGVCSTMLLLGFLDVKFKFAHLENSVMNSVIPELQNTHDIKEEIKEIKEMIKNDKRRRTNRSD